MSDSRKTLIRLVDDDGDLLDALSFMLESEGWETAVFENAQDFLDRDDASVAGCVIIDYAMPGMNGVELQKRLADEGWSHPVVFLTAHADLDMVIEVFRTGAVDFLQKPVRSHEFIATIAKAVEKDRTITTSVVEEHNKKYARLTQREKQILRLANLGLMNCQIAERLGLSERTVEVHRANGYRKLEIRSLAELALLLQRVEKSRGNQ